MYRFVKIKEWNISIENYFYRNIFSQFLTYICILFLYLRNYCAYSKYYIVKKQRSLTLFIALYKKKTCIKLKQKNGSLCFLIWFKIFVMPHNRIWKAYELLYSLQKWLMGFKNSFTCIQKEILKMLKKLVITQWLRSD